MTPSQPWRQCCLESHTCSPLQRGSPPAYDVSADGQRFVTVSPIEQGEPLPPKIRIVQNWYEEFRDREL